MTGHITAKKSLGQNWLVNEGVLDRIVAAAGISEGATVLEVGPGTGALTKRLAATGARVIAVEKDVRLIEPLRERFAGLPNVSIVEGDILSLDIRHLSLDISAYKVVANLPYYITSHFLRVMLEGWPPPQRAVLMVQREVARRMMASPPDMNLLALSVQAYAQIDKVMDVSRGSFRPMPDVDSAVIRLEVRSMNGEVRSQIRDSLKLAKKAFGQKRKQLKSSVPPELLAFCGIPSSARPQELALEQWLCLLH